jgi:hypothetical protein
MLVLIAPRKALRTYFCSESAVILQCMGVSNVEVTEMLPLGGLVGYLDGCWGLRNGELSQPTTARINI